MYQEVWYLCNVRTKYKCRTVLNTIQRLLVVPVRVPEGAVQHKWRYSFQSFAGGLIVEQVKGGWKISLVKCASSFIRQEDRENLWPKMKTSNLLTGQNVCFWESLRNTRTKNKKIKNTTSVILRLLIIICTVIIPRYY